MDKKGRIQEHSKIKLELYRLYLELYLTVLLNSGSFRIINIHDIFAGKGKSGNENGSALLAAIEIQKARSKYPGTQVSLRLNEKDANNFLSLDQTLTPFKNFTSLFNQDANEYISNWTVPVGSHNLFFIDPHGYTQVSTKNIKRLFSLGNCDFLIFVPIYHIYRFLKPSASAEQDDEDDDYGFLADLGIETPEKRTPVDKNKYYEPIAKFLSGLGIEKANAENANSVEEFSEMIIEALKSISGSDFVYSQMIKKKGKNSKYCLFYISQHILGAEKFLDARSQLIARIEESSQQQVFDFASDAPQSVSILDFVEYDHSYDNVTLYELGIKAGFRPTELKKELKDLEKSQYNRIKIAALPGKQRNRKGLYIDYPHYKEKDRIISIVFIDIPG